MKLLKTAVYKTLLAVFATACTTTKTSTYWVNSFKKDCDAGSAKTQCIQISKNDNLEQATWTYFYAPIAGFNFEPGYFQKIKVSETPKNKSNVPADVSSIDYKLIKVLDKKQDFRMALHDIWVATHINEEAITTTENLPRLEINTTQMKVFGTDGCNDYSGIIKSITSENIAFAPLASTRKMCAKMDIPNKYNNALNNSVRYKREHLNLYFYDSNGNNVLSFKKVD